MLKYALKIVTQPIFKTFVKSMCVICLFDSTKGLRPLSLAGTMNLFFYLNFIKNNFSAIMLIHSEHLNRKSNSGGKSRNRVFFSNLFINENKLLSFSEFMSFFAEFSHQFFCIQSSTQHSCQNKGENKIDFLVQFW